MVGETVKHYRMKRGLTLSKLAERAGVDIFYLRSLEKNLDVNPSMQFLEKVTPALGITIDTLLSESSLPSIDPMWNEIITEALERGLTTEEYIDFLEFAKKQSAETKIHHHLKTFLENQKLKYANRIS